MKPEHLFQELKDLAEKLGVTVSEQNLRTSGIRVKSGFCKVKGRNLFVIDKHKTLHQKNILLASFLNTMVHENIYIVPAVREFLSQHK